MAQPPGDQMPPAEPPPDPAPENVPPNEGDEEDPAPAGQKMTKEEERREDNRSAVRMIVTYTAAGFLFVVGAGIIGYLIGTNQVNDAKDVFLALLPIAAAIVTYWFATRKNETRNTDDLVKIIDAVKRAQK